MISQRHTIMITNRSLSLRPFAAAASCLVLSVAMGQTNNVAINRDGAAPHPHGILDVQGTTKGVLIPRMIDTERDAIAAPAQGLTVYVTAPTAEEGFWFYDNAMWNRIMPGRQWGLTGNASTAPGVLPGQNYLGTSDAVDLRFGTINVERAHLDQQGDFGVGVAAPVEKLDLLGAIKQTGTEATNTVGTIRYHTYNQPANGVAPAITYSQHEGNIDGTATGWVKLENDYNEIKGAGYTAAGSPIVCGAGSVDLGVANAQSATPTVSPWTINNAAASRYRHQYLFRAQDLNVELNQLNGNPLVTQGLCAGAQISSIAFNVVVAGGTKPGPLAVTIKHSLSTSLTGFDNTVDPAERCIAPGGTQPFPSGAIGWKTYTFLTPFVWDGIRGIVIDVQAAVGAGALVIPTVQTRSGLSYNATYSSWGAACAITGACGGTLSGCGTNGSATERPVIRFTVANNGVSTAPVATVANGDYVHYSGGLLVEGAPQPPPPPANWSQQIAPYYAFRGPGTIAAQGGVYDDTILLSDHVFDRHFDGQVMPSDATRYGGQRNLSVPEMAAYTEENRHLPTMKGRAEWQAHGGFGLGDITNQLWVTTETQAVYLLELNKRMDGLAVLSGTGPIDSHQLEAAKSAIATMGTLTESEKATLVQGCTARLSPEPATR